MFEQEEDPGQEPVMISALEHYSYCPRQCALIHIEQTFDENIYTLKGHLAHERTDQKVSRDERGVRVERALSLWSRRLGLIGQADVVEFHGNVPYPIEYKLGKRREWSPEAIQLCAQAVCLEEMLGVAIPRGAIYYCSSRERREVSLEPQLREMVEEITCAVRAMLKEGVIPSAVADQRCKKCSLIESCLPNVVTRPDRLSTYRSTLFRAETDEFSSPGEELRRRKHKI